MTSEKISPVAAFVAHAESLISGRRLLLIDSPSSGLSERLLERGARAVHVLDPRAGKGEPQGAGTSKRIRVDALHQERIAELDFDTALVADLSSLSNAGSILRSIERHLPEDGCALVACPSDESVSGLFGVRPGKLSFDGFSALVHDSFESVKLLAQTPFVGMAVVHLDLSAPPEPALDNGFLAGEADELDLYLAICTKHPLGTRDLQEMTIVQLPSRGLTAGVPQHAGRAEGARPTASSSSPEFWAERAQVAELRAENQKLLERVRQLEIRAKRADEVDGAQAELAQLKSSHQSITYDLARAKSELANAKSDAQRVAHDSEGEKKNLEKQIALLRQENQKRSAEWKEVQRFIELGQQVGELREVHKAERAAAAEREQRASLEIGQLEQQLEERGLMLLEVEAKLGELERFTRSLAAELKAERLLPRPSAGPSDVEQRLTSDLEKAAQRLAEREADLVEAQWTIESLQKKLGGGHRADPRAT